MDVTEEVFQVPDILVENRGVFEHSSHVVTLLTPQAPMSS